jgi:hypothetical protein
MTSKTLPFAALRSPPLTTRLAATALAERVAQEMADGSAGGLCGYRIRGETKVSRRILLTFAPPPSSTFVASPPPPLPPSTFVGHHPPSPPSLPPHPPPSLPPPLSLTSVTTTTTSTPTLTLHFVFLVSLVSRLQVSDRTALTFVTTGILLRQLEHDPALEALTHLVGEWI